MKRVSLILIFLAVTAAVCSAVDFDFVVGQKTSASLEFDNSAGEMKPKFLFNVDAELDMDFSKGHGMLVVVNPYSTGGSVEFALSTGYAYQDSISSNVDIIASVGPSFIFSSSGVGFAVFANVDFDIYVTQSMFVRVGTGIEIGFGDFGSQEFGKRDLTINIPLPALGLGWTF